MEKKKRSKEILENCIWGILLAKRKKYASDTRINRNAFRTHKTRRCVQSSCQTVKDRLDSSLFPLLIFAAIFLRAWFCEQTRDKWKISIFVDNKETEDKIAARTWWKCDLEFIFSCCAINRLNKPRASNKEKPRKPLPDDPATSRF